MKYQALRREAHPSTKSLKQRRTQLACQLSRQPNKTCLVGSKGEGLNYDQVVFNFFRSVGKIFRVSVIGVTKCVEDALINQRSMNVGGILRNRPRPFISKALSLETSCVVGSILSSP